MSDDTTTDPVDQADKSEALDDDNLAGNYPPDEPVGVDEYGITEAEQRVDEPIAERVLREEPEVTELGQAQEVGRLVAPDEGIGPDDESAAVASAVERLPEDQIAEGDIGVGDSTTRDTATERVPDLSAEEAAMHLVDED